MGSGSREQDYFNQMADMGKGLEDNKAALNDLRSNFVGPIEEEPAPAPTRVNLDEVAMSEPRNSEVDQREKAYMAIRRLGEAGHDAAHILLTPDNVTKLAQWEDKAQRIEQARMAYEQDPQKYAMDSANALDGYIASWNQKNLTPEQRTGASPAVTSAAEAINEAAPSAVAQEVQGVDRNVATSGLQSEGHYSEGGGEAPTPRRQPSRGQGGQANRASVSQGGNRSQLHSAGASGITTGPTRQQEVEGRKKAGLADPNGPQLISGSPAVDRSGPSKVGALKPGDKFFEMRGSRPDAPSGNVAYQETMAQMLPSALAAVPAAAMIKEGLPGKMAEKVETELIPGAMNMGRKIASKLSSKESAPTREMVENSSFKTVPNIQSGRMQGMSPEAKAAQLRQPQRPTSNDVRQTIRNAESGTNAVRDSFGYRDGSARAAAAQNNPVNAGLSKRPAKNAAELAHKASEYLDARDAGSLPKVPRETVSSSAPSREPMRSQRPRKTGSSRPSSGGVGEINSQGGKITGVGGLNKPKRPEPPAPAAKPKRAPRARKKEG